MAELLEALGALQSNGGLLAVFVWMVLEVRSLRRDFGNHAHADNGKPFIKIQ